MGLIQNPKSMDPKFFGDPFVTLWAFLSQVLDADKTCHNTVSRVIAWKAYVEAEIPSVDTSAYCQARKLCCEKLLQRLFRNVELDLKHLKTTLGMDVLRSQTPEMARKEIYVYMLAYNLLRLRSLREARTLMWEAGTTHSVNPLRLSVQRTRQHLNNFAEPLVSCVSSAEGTAPLGSARNSISLYSN